MIQLTEKDADFIANLARQEIEQYQEAYENTLERINDIADFVKTLTQEHPFTTELEEYQNLQDEYYKSLNDTEQKYEEIKNKWQKVIELMLTGSEL